ncbi:hypothetical protein ACHAWF_015555 [Thalassiosira exigua]
MPPAGRPPDRRTRGSAGRPAGAAPAPPRLERRFLLVAFGWGLGAVVFLSLSMGRIDPSGMEASLASARWSWGLGGGLGEASGAARPGMRRDGDDGVGDGRDAGPAGRGTGRELAGAADPATERARSTRDSNAAARIAAMPPTHFSPVDEGALHDGRVVRELSRRILSRNIAQSNVLVVSAGFDDGARSGDTEAAEHYFPAKYAMDQGHATRLLPASSPRRASGWLSNATVTYLVFPVCSRASIPLSSILDEEPEYERDLLADMTVEVAGLTAAETLLDHRYKLQLLAATHHFDDPDDGARGEGGEGSDGFDYGPNSLFMSAKALHRFLYERASRALRTEVAHFHKTMRSPTRRGAVDVRPGRTLEVRFHSLLFATQGLDLAIPARSSYVDVGNHVKCRDPSTGRRRRRRCDPKLGARAMNDTIFLRCPSRHESPDLQFVDPTNLGELRVAGMRKNDPYHMARKKRRAERRTSLERRNGVAVDLNGEWMKEEDVATGEVELWRGSEDPRASEAACVRTDKSAIFPRVACATRVVPVPAAKLAASTEPIDRRGGAERRPNLLVVMMDPLSRAQLRRSLPNTWALLRLLGFVEFPRYSAVGPNSGPNQAALYSGTPLIQGREGIRSSHNATARLWLWDRLKAAGYVTLKAEDGCISNSNMVQSIRPRTHHGQQLHEMFCFSYDRPNCLGGKLAAQHLADYARQFIETYHRRQSGKSSHARPWAAFLSFLDSHEDSLTLVHYLDGILVDLLQDVPLKDEDNTMVVFLSDHGLHYGPSFASKSGEDERAQPLLWVRMPSFRAQKVKHLRPNALKFATPYDVHETILDVLLQARSNNPLGMSLVKLLPESRSACNATKAIPPEFCPRSESPSGECTFMIDPPSVFSFYSDIPPSNRPRWPRRCPTRRNHTLDAAEPCFCATNSRDWFDCSEISRNDFRAGISSSTEHFSLRSCGKHEMDHTLELEIHVRRDEKLVESRKSLAAQSMKKANAHHGADAKASFDAQPNIVFLEIDSVSLSFSERFFPKTWGLLQQHRIVTEEGVAPSCPTGWCAGAFNKTSVVGQSSVVNQLAALSGCMISDDGHEKLHHYAVNGTHSHCPKGGKFSFGTRNKEDHWLFDVAKNLGYLTFFGEEFCYEESPYVVQTQSAFTLDVDFTLGELHCSLARDWLKVQGRVNSGDKTWSVEYEDMGVPCFDGRSRSEISLSFIAHMFQSYDSLPKFAFLNALAGPYPIDYSTQIEHMNPWTAIIAPQNHQSFSIEPFSSNQNRLVTGFDIYQSIRYLMSPSLAKQKNEQRVPLFDAGIPQWSYNLFQESIPLSRNCQEAKIPREFCPCTEERSDLAPSFYVGHSEQKKYDLEPELKYDWKSEKFAARKLPGLLLPLDQQYKYDVQPNRNVSIPRCNQTLDSYVDENMLRDSWGMIDKITELYPGSDVSGGIFLYQRQQLLIAYLVQQEIASRAADGLDPNNVKPFRVCETGFGSGHSAALFLSAAPNVEVVTFDKFNRPYQNAIVHGLWGYFGRRRLTRVFGDSCETVKSYGKKCDFLHGSSLCPTDNIDLISKSSGVGVTLTSTAMNSLEDGSVYFGKRKAKWARAKFGELAQFQNLTSRACIENTLCFQEMEVVLDAHLYLARGKSQTTTHKFCFAMNTGICTGHKRTATQGSWRRDHFCPHWMLPTP